jgi:hypothetical protein
LGVSFRLLLDKVGDFHLIALLDAEKFEAESTVLKPSHLGHLGPH